MGKFLRKIKLCLNKDFFFGGGGGVGGRLLVENDILATACPNGNLED